MKGISKGFIYTAVFLGVCMNTYAGNKDRSGQAGAMELNINPWARSTGLFGMNTPNVYGIEAMKSNIAGLAVDSTSEVGLSIGDYLQGTNIKIADFAVAQKVGEGSVVGFNIMSMSFGQIPATNFFNPDGYGSYQPTFLNASLGFAKQFSAHINAGVQATFVSEQINNIGASGLAFDGGIQYVTGKRDNFHFGIALRNIGTNMRYTGTGFSINADQPESSPTFGVTAQYPSDKFEMPTSLNFGLAYDLYLDEHHLSTSDSLPKHRLTVLGDFQSNSFNNDYLGGGLEYSFRNMFMLRCAYRYESGIGNLTTTSTMYVGLAFGATLQYRMGGVKGHLLAFDYSFRPTQRPANGVHMFSIRYSR